MKCFKGCPKCNGTVYPERHLGGAVEFVCIQCGKNLNAPEIVALLRKNGVKLPVRKAATPVAPAAAAPAAPMVHQPLAA